jgi:hypothetical protein
MRWIAALLSLFVLAGSASAARGDPQRELRAADQARAKSVILRRSDFNPGYVVRPTVRPTNRFYCAALDESDLTITGEAWSPSFNAGTESVTSFAVVYASRSDADASWKRGTSAAGLRCLRTGVERDLQPPLRLVSFRPRAFPRQAARSFALRAVVQSRGIRVYVDTVVLQAGRIQIGLSYSSALAPPPEGELRRLAGRLAARAEKESRS